MRLGEMDGGGGFVGVEGKGGRPFVPRVERQGNELVVVILTGDEIGVDQSEMGFIFAHMWIY